MHDPQVLMLLAAVLAALCWRVALKLLITVELRSMPGV